MNRYELAYQYHVSGYNCAQAVIGAFTDKTGLTLEQSMAIAGGFGGGVGGCHEELCGALSGGIMVLGLLFPHLCGGDAEGKKAFYQLTREFRERFLAIFSVTRCEDLLAAEPGLNAKTTEAAKLEIKEPCDILIVTAVQLVEQMLKERAN